MEIFSHVWRFSVLFGDFLSFSLEIFSHFLFGDFQSFFFGDFQSGIWRFSVDFVEIFSRFMEIFVADLLVSGQGTGRKAGKRAAP